MIIRTITYKKVKNLGNYQTAHLEMSAELAEGEDYEQCYLELKKIVDYLLDGGVASKSPENF